MTPTSAEKEACPPVTIRRGRTLYITFLFTEFECTSCLAHEVLDLSNRFAAPYPAWTGGRESRGYAEVCSSSAGAASPVRIGGAIRVTEQLGFAPGRAGFKHSVVAVHMPLWPSHYVYFCRFLFAVGVLIHGILVSGTHSVCERRHEFYVIITWRNVRALRTAFPYPSLLK